MRALKHISSEKSSLTKAARLYLREHLPGGHPGGFGHLAADDAGQLQLTPLPVQGGDLRISAAVPHLLGNKQMMVCLRGDLRQMRNAEDLTAA